FQAEDGIRDRNVTGVQTCALPIFQVGQGCGGHGVASLSGSSRSGSRSMRRSNPAFRATITVDADMRSAPTLIGMTNPMGASTPAASGTAMRLYALAHHRFCFIFR